MLMKCLLMPQPSSRAIRDFWAFHLNDGYGKRDDGLIAGSVHPIQTIELLVALKHIGYNGILYFDTFPDTAGIDPVSRMRNQYRSHGVDEENS